MSLQDKVILITGGGSGIGANTAQAFVAAGAKVVLNSRRLDVLKNTATEIDPTGKHIAWVAGDIGQAKIRQEIVSSAVEHFGGVDILFNNAGVFEPKPFLAHTEADLESYLNLLRGYFFLTQIAIAEMQKRGGGAIINTGSMWALHAIAATPCSGSSTAKGAVHALTKNLAIEFAPDKIRVNAIAPAVVETSLFDSLLTSEQLASFNNFHPLGRNGQVQDITQSVLFLADGDRSGWITGVVLPVDGGVTAGRN
ncbi:MAG: SDR family oxidoreductase [Pleurocapsa minor HA4230-MV1]|jgi:NAD(P)-dependent dehydrogenase (short-subunit alcohol dehydrogenase family)|nr:SDR family oxidoreductase [Pleurocapsa minor HA4230-MV1]